jgi:hypothetical protein
MFDPASFDQAFVATAYLLGARDARLVEGLPTVSTEAQRLRQKLGHADRNQRAAALAAELARFVGVLSSGRLR